MTTLHPYTDDAPVVYLIGYGYRPAYQPADFVGPRLDCPMWLPTADSDAAYASKYDAHGHAPAIPPTPGYVWGTWIPSAQAPADRITEAELAGPIPGTVPAVWHLPTPSQPWWPSEPNEPKWPCCIIIGPEPELPPIAPVPVSASGVFLFTALAVLALLRRRAK